MIKCKITDKGECLKWKQQATSNKQQATSNKQQATSNKQQATSNKQQAGKHELLVYRLCDILIRLNQGERLDARALAQDYQVCTRTIARDLNNRLSLLHFSQAGPRYYQLDISKQGYLKNDDIERIARFAGITGLLPRLDRHILNHPLQHHASVKGFAYENTQTKTAEFETIASAIDAGHFIEFNYRKVGANQHKSYTLAPYHLVNKNGIWYVVGLDGEQQKTFCFNQIRDLKSLKTTFKIDQNLQASIRTSDSIYYGNQVECVEIQINSNIAEYFQRRQLLPNQSNIRELSDGTLLITCKKVNQMEIIPIIQFWIPHAKILTPAQWQKDLINKLKFYLHQPKQGT